MKKPTTSQYEALEHCYDYFNQHLFDGKLPAVIFTTQRKKHMLGYYSNKRWKSANNEVCDEIAINPDYIAHVSYIKLMQTIVHEMAHCWQFHYGKPSRGGYHNHQWGNKMRSIGLIPSNTGEPGGQALGQQMDDYPDPNGKFIKLCLRLLNKKIYPIHWVDRYGQPVSLDIDKIKSANEATQQLTGELAIEQVPEIIKLMDQRKDEPINQPLPPRRLVNQSKLKYTCQSCNINIWGKPRLNIICGDCGIQLVTHE